MQIPSWDARLFDLRRAAESEAYCDEVRGVLAALVAHGALAEGALAVVERSVRSQAPWPTSGWEELRKRDYGDTALWYGRASRSAVEEA